MKSLRQKREEANARQEKYNKLSLKAKLALIESRPGKSKRETDRILRATSNKIAKAVVANLAKGK